MTIHEALELARRCDYAHEAAEQQTNPINWADAAAFFLEGYQRQQRDLDAARARIKKLTDKVEEQTNEADEWRRAALDAQQKVHDLSEKIAIAALSAKGGNDGT